MAFIDYLQEAVNKLAPSKHSKIPSLQTGAGIGNGHGQFMSDDMIVSKQTIIFHTTQIFFNFLAMACFASVAGFQAKWKEIGVSGLSGFALFVTISGMALSLFMLMVPVIYEKYDKGARLARALKEVRVGFILSGSGAIFSLLIAFIVTISAWTEPGCKNPDNDPHKDLGDDFKKQLPGWCNTKKAAGIFLWLAFVGWAGTLTLTVMDWRSGNTRRPRDPPFQHPAEPSEDVFEDDATRGDAESTYQQIPPINVGGSSLGGGGGGGDANAPRSPFGDEHARYSGYSGNSGGAPAMPRASMDAYGAFSDPAPSGFGGGAGGGGGSPGGGNVSRTMQYADPYAAVRASIAGQPPAASTPPGYESYQGYR